MTEHGPYIAQSGTTATHDLPPTGSSVTMAITLPTGFQWLPPDFTDVPKYLGHRIVRSVDLHGRPLHIHHYMTCHTDKQNGLALMLTPNDLNDHQVLYVPLFNETPADATSFTISFGDFSKLTADGAVPEEVCYTLFVD